MGCLRIDTCVVGPRTCVTSVCVCVCATATPHAVHYTCCCFFETWMWKYIHWICVWSEEKLVQVLRQLFLQDVFSSLLLRYLKWKCTDEGWGNGFQSFYPTRSHASPVHFVETRAQTLLGDRNKVWERWQGKRYLMNLVKTILRQYSKIKGRWGTFGDPDPKENQCFCLQTPGQIPLSARTQR